MNEPQKIAHPRSFGWLRRPDLDKTGLHAWERPDGQIFYWGVGAVPMVSRGEVFGAVPSGIA